jgi:hypothetical protein
MKLRRTLEFMPDNYFRACDIPEIVEHLKLVRSFFENVSSRGEQPLAAKIKWKASRAKPQYLRFCTWEREQLLAKIAGSFSVVPINILSADTFPAEIGRSGRLSSLQSEGACCDRPA